MQDFFESYYGWLARKLAIVLLMLALVAFGVGCTVAKVAHATAEPTIVGATVLMVSRNHQKPEPFVVILVNSRGETRDMGYDACLHTTECHDALKEQFARGDVTFIEIDVSSPVT